MSLIDRYVADLFDYAKENAVLDSFYNYAKIIMHGSDSELPDDLHAFLELLSPEDAEAVLIKFIGVAREELGLLDVQIFSATLLSVAQRAKIEAELVSIFDKGISPMFRVDPSLIGGLRVVVGNTVFDNSVKTRLAEMKKNVYKEVYLK